MRVVEIIFSPTGGTEKVVKIITSNWSDNRKRIDLSDAKTDFSKTIIEKEDMVLIAMPVFGSRPPAIAIERLNQIKGNGAKCCVVCVYGNGAYENTLDEMKNAAEESGFEVIGAIAAIAQHSIISEYATERPDEKDIAQLKEFSEKILAKEGPISSNLEFNTPTEVEDTDSKPVPPSAPPLPKPTESCIKCGICAQKCPTQAITEDFISDIGKCNFCMRCVKECPNQSRKVDEEVIAAAALALKETCSIRKENELFL